MFKKETVAQKRDLFFFLAEVGLAFRSPASCGLSSGRLTPSRRIHAPSPRQLGAGVRFSSYPCYIKKEKVALLRDLFFFLAGVGLEPTTSGL